MKIHVNCKENTLSVFESTSVPEIGSALFIDDADGRKTYSVVNCTWVIGHYSAHHPESKLSYVCVEVLHRSES